jgi:phage gp29-like protein
MTKRKSVHNYAIPGKPLTPQEIAQMLHEAKNGQFHSMEAVKEKIKEWKTKFAK